MLVGLERVHAVEDMTAEVKPKFSASSDASGLEWALADSGEEDRESGVTIVPETKENGVLQENGNSQYSNLLRASNGQGGRGEDVDDNTCPFIYDEYVFKLPGNIYWHFRPSDHGFSHGYYCSISSTSGLSNYSYNFGGCECPPARFCSQDWGTVDVSLSVFGKLEMQVGKCQMYNWILIMPIVIFFCLVCCCLRYCGKKSPRAREVIIVRADPRSDYARMT